jgi:hypothetical protein
MKRLLTSALAGAVVVAAGTAGEAQAQDMMGRRASAFELGIYGGGAYTTSWFTTPGTPASGGDDIDWAPGLSPIFGATAAFFFTPSLGLRLHGAYMPQELPQEEGVFEREGYLVNGYLYDLDLVFRPWIATGNGWMADTYFFLGGGGATTNIAGEAPSPGCAAVANWRANGICMSVNPTLSTTGQGVIGVGSTFMPLMGLGLFGELAVHGYDSPAHGPDDNSPLRGEDKFTFTPRLVLGLKAMFGNLIAPPPVVLPPPPPVVETTPPPPPPPPPAVTRDIQVCVVEGGALRNVTATYNTQTADTMYQGRRFNEAFPATTGYAGGATWYINTEPITINGRRYVKYGLPRVLGVTEVTRTAEYQGVSVFAEAGATGTPEVVYVPVRTGCEFQPYQLEVKAGAVRGEE